VVIASINSLLAELKIDHQGLADRLGIKLQRVRDLASGRAKKFSPEEIRALVEELHVSADWLATGVGAMFRQQAQESRDDFERRMQVINDLGVVVDALPLAASEKKRTKAALTGDLAHDAELIARPLQPASGSIVDVALVVRIAAAVESALTKNRARIAQAKKEELVKLLYDHFSAKGRFEEETVERHLKLVINH
jgi:DNA-binding Xre family transcriptional regulator